MKQVVLKHVGQCSANQSHRWVSSYWTTGYEPSGGWRFVTAASRVWGLAPWLANLLPPVLTLMSSFPSVLKQHTQGHEMLTCFSQKTFHVFSIGWWFCGTNKARHPATEESAETHNLSVLVRIESHVTSALPCIYYIYLKGIYFINYTVTENHKKSQSGIKLESCFFLILFLLSEDLQKMIRGTSHLYRQLYITAESGA